MFGSSGLGKQAFSQGQTIEESIFGTSGMTSAGYGGQGYSSCHQRLASQYDQIGFGASGYREAFNQSQFAGSSFAGPSSQGYSGQEVPPIQSGFVSTGMSYIEYGFRGSQIGEAGFRGPSLVGPLSQFDSGPSQLIPSIQYSSRDLQS